MIKSRLSKIADTGCYAVQTTFEILIAWVDKTTTDDSVSKHIKYKKVIIIMCEMYENVKPFDSCNSIWIGCIGGRRLSLFGWRRYRNNGKCRQIGCPIKRWCNWILCKRFNGDCL